MWHITKSVTNQWFSFGFTSIRVTGFLCWVAKHIIGLLYPVLVAGLLRRHKLLLSMLKQHRWNLPVQVVAWSMQCPHCQYDTSLLQMLCWYKWHLCRYEEGNTTLWKVGLASDFIWSDSQTPLEFLGSYNLISFDNQESLPIKNHELTTDDVRNWAYCLAYLSIYSSHRRWLLIIWFVPDKKLLWGFTSIG